MTIRILKYLSSNCKWIMLSMLNIYSRSSIKKKILWHMGTVEVQLISTMSGAVFRNPVSSCDNSNERCLTPPHSLCSCPKPGARSVVVVASCMWYVFFVNYFVIKKTVQNKKGKFQNVLFRGKNLLLSQKNLLFSNSYANILL